MTRINAKVVPLVVKLQYRSLLQDVADWLDDPRLPVNMFGQNKKYRLLRSLVEFDDSILSPYAFLDFMPLTKESVLYCFENCPYIYSPSRLVDFLCYLGCKSAKGGPVTYNHVYTWRLPEVEKAYIERKHYYFSDCYEGDFNDRQKFLKLQLLDFLKDSAFYEDFLARLESNDFPNSAPVTSPIAERFGCMKSFRLQ